MDHTLTFHVETRSEPVVVRVPTGTLVSEAADRAGIEIGQPCGGQGRCGRCVIQVKEGSLRQRSSLRLSREALAEGYALACQAIAEVDAVVHVPEQEAIKRQLATDRLVADVSVPQDYEYPTYQTVRRLHLTLTPPSMDDQTDDCSRLLTAFRKQHAADRIEISLPLLSRMGAALRLGDWRTTAIVETDPSADDQIVRLIDLRPGFEDDYSPLWGLAIDIGTTTVTVWLVDLIRGKVRRQVAEYNGQIARGEDVISRIVYASKDGGRDDLRQRVLDTINKLVDLACLQAKADPATVVKVSIAGNSTMMHLLLGIPPENIRLSPFITTVNHVPPLTASEVGLKVCPDAAVDCLPGVASYVGADIAAGVLASGLDRAENTTVFLDVGTNGETVLGNRDWLVTCACSAGPAFEGAGVMHGMRATEGAIEDVWINSRTFEPTYRVIGNTKPKGICGSGLIALLSEMFVTGVLDKAGNVNLQAPTARVREGAHGAEYVVAWAPETQAGEDIVLSRVDTDNLLRAKAAIYAGFTVLADTVGVPLDSAEKILIGGSFGKYINVEKAVQIGLLPDLPWPHFDFLGNTSVKGAYLALLDWRQRQRIAEIARRMTYVELSADNSFYEAFTAALFLPHTDLSRFPSVEAVLKKTRLEDRGAASGLPDSGT